MYHPARLGYVTQLACMHAASAHRYTIGLHVDSVGSEIDDGGLNIHTFIMTQSKSGQLAGSCVVQQRVCDSDARGVCMRGIEPCGKMPILHSAGSPLSLDKSTHARQEDA